MSSQCQRMKFFISVVIITVAMTKKPQQEYTGKEKRYEPPQQLLRKQDDRKLIHGMKNETDKKEKDDENFDLRIKSLEELCDIFPPFKLNCTCSNTDIKNILKSMKIYDKICQVNLTTPTIKIVIRQQTVLVNTYASVSTVLMIIALLGNTMVLIVTCSKRKKRTKYQTLIALLAVIDLVFAVLHVITITPLFWTNHWVYHQVGCKILPSAMTLGSLLGFSITLLISFERYIGIVHSLDYIKYERSLTVFLPISIVLCFASVFPIAWFSYITRAPSLICSVKWTSRDGRLGYYGYLLAIFTIFPVVIVSAAYTKIVHVLRKNLRENKFNIKKDSAEFVKQYKRNIRIMQILLITAIMYALSQLPHRIIVLVFNIHKHGVAVSLDEFGISSHTYNVLSFLSHIPYSFHLVMNPIIYSIVDANWRKEFSLVLRQCCGKPLPRLSVTNTDARYKTSQSEL